MELQLIDEDSTFWGDNFPNLERERQAGAFTHVLSVVFARGSYLWGLAEAVTHGRRCVGCGALRILFCSCKCTGFRARLRGCEWLRDF